MLTCCCWGTGKEPVKAGPISAIDEGQQVLLPQPTDYLRASSAKGSVPLRRRAATLDTRDSIKVSGFYQRPSLKYPDLTLIRRTASDSVTRLALRTWDENSDASPMGVEPGLGYGVDHFVVERDIANENAYAAGYSYQESPHDSNRVDRCRQPGSELSSLSGDDASPRSDAGSTWYENWLVQDQDFKNPIESLLTPNDHGNYRTYDGC